MKRAPCPQMTHVLAGRACIDVCDECISSVIRLTKLPNHTVSLVQPSVVPVMQSANPRPSQVICGD